MKPTVERLSEQFRQLIGPEAFAKAEAAIAAAKTAAEAAAKAAAEKAAAAAAAAKAAAAAAPVTATPAVAAATPAAAAKPPVAPTPATAQPAPRVAPVVPAASVAATTVAAAGGATPQVTPAAAPRPAPVAGAPAAPRPAVPAAAAAARPLPVAAPAPAPMPTLPVQVVDHAAKGYHFDAVVAPNQVVEAAQLLDREGFGLDAITGVDWMAQNEMEVVYDYFHPTEPTRVVVRTRVPRATPELPTISNVFPGANWHERETHDFFGIRFTGHPNMKPFLLPEDADFHPLRKDYK